MLIGIISDTHIPVRTQSLPEKVFEVFKNVDMIFHCGDIEVMSVIEELEKIAPVRAVHGNCDPYIGFNTHEVIEVDDVKIGLTHGVVYPKGDCQQLYYLAKELGVDILVSGHTHRPLIKQEADVLLLNPGSATQPRLSEPSVMLLEVNGSEVNAEVVKIGRPTCKALDFSQFSH
ncbi:MAG: YfcE family phosphodiesterase [Methanosphaera sp.]|uniref:YfcE family phosphodiesterase n=1 Tax=Methanosphaera sp. ISO3-F5 TaxID=1452353 RepID=UPI002B262CA7|nr:YfcE family phosphodiesterase [Methanosphaera sp. ISO3-F5]MBR0472417.1 YfcE family phosphodiesterase [Methanosphaera sp.]WQH65274.1 YfcE family phosphodiesterase [Methanosphaera sp. ISO3-F5]